MASKKSQKALLQKLEEYGNSLLEEENHSKKAGKLQCQAKTDILHEDQNQRSLQITPMKNKKKKLKKKQKKLIKNQQNGDIVKSNKKPQMNKKLKWLREALGSDGVFEVEKKKNESSSEAVEDNKRQKKEAEVIVFEDPTRKKKSNAVKSGGTITSVNTSEFDMRSARFEVRKLGISGFAGEQKSDARVSMLIKLGAKPPKKKSYINYKEFQQKRKKEIDAEKQKCKEEQVPGEKVVKSKSKKRPCTKPDFGVDGQVGHYKDGVQFISKDALKKMKKS